MQSKQKVLVYVTRNEGSEILVFRHRDHPEAGIQVPAGTVEAGESVLAAGRRELFEESGVEAGDLRFLGESAFANGDCLHHRHVLHVELEGLADAWEHRVGGGGEDEGLVFCYFWLPSSLAQAQLAADMGACLPWIRRL